MMYALAILGQILFGLYWVIAGYNHFKNLSGFTGYAMAKNVPMPKLAVAGSGLIMILGGLGILLGLNPLYSAIPLIVFIIPTTLMIHNFWRDQDPITRESNKIQFMKNMALFGALLLIMNLTATPYSFFW